MLSFVALSVLSVNTFNRRRQRRGGRGQGHGIPFLARQLPPRPGRPQPRARHALHLSRTISTLIFD